MSCHCQSDERGLALVAAQLTERCPEFVEVAESLGWQIHPEMDAAVLEVGAGHEMSGLSEVNTFLRAVLPVEQWSLLRAAWIKRCEPLESQRENFARAETLASLSAIDGSQLLGILNRRGIETWYQPVFKLDTMELWGYECLMRAADENGNLITAVQLLEWARHENLILMLDRVCRETHLINAGLALAGRDCMLLLNFLPTAIYRPEYCLRSTVAAAKRSGLRPEQIIFEVVETENMADRNHLRRIMDYYRERGFRVALDDVGSGYAGLAMLADLDPNLIKIDRELLTKAPHSPLHRQICSLLVTLGRESGKLVLAEGIETQAEHQLVAEWGVDLVQGFRYGRPAPTMATQPLAAC